MQSGAREHGQQQSGSGAMILIHRFVQERVELR